MSHEMAVRKLSTALLVAVGLVATSLPAPAVAGNADYGRTWRKDGALRSGCHDYRFNYRVRPAAVLDGANDDWAAEFFLVDPRGRGLGTVAKDSDVDPRRGRGSYRVCRETTRPGRFKIRGKLSVYDEGQLQDEVWIKVGRFRLRRP
jgi:hypothetical protein